MGIFSRSETQTTQQIADGIVNPAPAHTVQLVKRGSAAVSRDTVAAAQGGISLVKKFDKAGISLSKRGLAGVDAEVVLYIDHSGSMTTDYRVGHVQNITDRVLAFGLQVDADGKIPVIAWDNDLHREVEVTLNNYADIVDNKVWRKHKMGGTQILPVIRDIIERAKQTTKPLYAIIITDDDPYDGHEAFKYFLDSASYPVFIKILTTVDTPDSGLANRLDDDKGLLVGQRLLDNIDAQTVKNINELSDLQFADLMAEEWNGWFVAAEQARVLA